MIVFRQLNYTKTRWFHAISMPVIIEFSRCMGTYLSAKFELFTIMLYMIGCGMVLLWVYFFILDYNAKLDLGKRLMKIEILSDNQKLSRSMALKHSALKMLAGSIWPISFTYYFIKHKMLYDKFLSITIKDKSELAGK